MHADEYIKARKSQLKFYRDVELYTRVKQGGFVLYKQTGMTLNDLRLEHGVHPEALYIQRSERLKGLKEAQKGFNRELESLVRSNHPEKIQETVINVVSETLTEPRSGSLEGVADTVGILASDYVKESNVIKNLLDMSQADYSIVLHSINVMAFALAYAFHMNYSEVQAKELGLCALLHDVGKTKINEHLLAAPRKLTDQEFEQIKNHTTVGFAILRECRFASTNISLTALEHHEKLDGSGYPQGKRRFSEAARIIGLIDCYEALTTDERPYRDAMGPFDTLETVIGNEVKAGKYDKDIYREFVRSLGGMPVERKTGADLPEVMTSPPL